VHWFAYLEVHWAVLNLQEESGRGEGGEREGRGRGEGGEWEGSGRGVGGEWEGGGRGVGREWEDGRMEGGSVQSCDEPECVRTGVCVSV
jgi:hypothetical protein